MRITSLILALSLPAATQGADLTNGKRLADRWCSPCHVVSPKQSQGSADVPSFADIGRRYDEQYLTNFLGHPYPQMPDLNLTNADAADLAAFIRSLAPTGKKSPEN